MLPKPKRLTKKRDFLKLGSQGRPVYGKVATMRVRKVEAEEPKVAFITSTKMFKLSVDRNRIKRRLREIIRLSWDLVPKHVHIILIAKPEAKEMAFEEMKTDVLHMLEKVPEALTKPAKPSPRHRKMQEKRKAASV